MQYLELLKVITITLASLISIADWVFTPHKITTRWYGRLWNTAAFSLLIVLVIADYAQ